MRRGSRTTAMIREEADLGTAARLSDTDKSEGGTDDDGDVAKRHEYVGSDVVTSNVPTTGILASWRGASILLITSTAQLLDNVS